MTNAGGVNLREEGLVGMARCEIQTRRRPDSPRQLEYLRRVAVSHPLLLPGRQASSGGKEPIRKPLAPIPLSPQSGELARIGAKSLQGGGRGQAADNQRTVFRVPIQLQFYRMGHGIFDQPAGEWGDDFGFNRLL